MTGGKTFLCKFFFLLLALTLLTLQRMESVCDEMRPLTA